MSHDILISIYIPTYNRAELVERAINSVLNQTITNIEIIVVDDQSTDDTIDVLTRLSKIDHRLQIYINPVNSGACYSRNFAIKIAKGRYITGLDDDDYFKEDRLESFLESWSNKEENVIALYSDVMIKHKQGDFELLCNPKYVDFDKLLVSNCVGNQIFIERNTLLTNSLEFDRELKSWQDLDLWLAILSKNKTMVFKNAIKPTYIFDKSHPHERISSIDVNKHLKSYEHIISKYNLSIIQKSRIKCQAYIYNTKSVSFFELIKFGFLSLNINTMLRLFKYYIFNLKKN
jgi:glycosyltransferase involved in cell wall biosynthesis